MIQRERVASGEAKAVSGPAGSRHAPAHPEGSSGTLSHRVPVWEDLYGAISPEQQRELLSLAERQGVLYAHQLPVKPNGAALEATRPLLAGMLNGDVAELLPLHAKPIEIGD